MINLHEATPGQQKLNRRARGFYRDKLSGGLMCVSGKRYVARFSTALQARLAYERVTSEAEPEFASTFFTDTFNELIRSACQSVGNTNG